MSDLAGSIARKQRELEAAANGNDPAAGAENGPSSGAAGLRTRGVIMARVRPIRWLWARRFPLGLPSLLVGEEAIGKGTVMAWVVAKATRGQLEGDLEGQPINVLIIGDEDGFETVWVPRLYAAGGDLGRLLTLDDGEYLDDLNARAEDLDVTVKREEIGLIVLDALIDHVNGGPDGSGVYNPKNIRRAMMPLRRVAGSHGIAAIGLLHPRKGHAATFRDLIAGSHQFNAVSRSSLLLGADPADKNRRILVRGKGNHSAAPRSFEFRIGVHCFELNGHGFEMPVVADAEEGDRSIDDLLEGTSTTDAPVRDALAEQLEPLLTTAPEALADLARSVDRDPKDGSVRNALESLATDRRAVKDKRGWTRGPRWMDGRAQASGAGGTVQPREGVAPSPAEAPPEPGAFQGEQGALGFRPPCCCEARGELDADGRCSQCFGWPEEAV